jgi:16S rRNA processing protein RimM
LNRNELKLTRTRKSAGSLIGGEPAYFDAGFIRRPHGVRGELLMEILQHYQDVVIPGKVIFLGEEHLPMTLLSIRPHNQGLLIQLDGIGTPEQAGQYRLQHVYVSSLQNRKALGKGEYFFDELLGLRVISDLDQELGEVSEIIETGANDVYVVSSPGRKDILLPAIPAVIRAIDLEKSEIHVHLLPGLEEI